MPGRLLVVGDSLCAFNPAYGQGLTVAAKEAEVLAEARRLPLHSRPDPSAGGSTRRDRGAGQGSVDAVDRVGPAIPDDGRRAPDPDGQGRHQYLDRALAAVSDDATVSAAFLRVLNMIDEPQALFAPRLMPRTAPAPTSGPRPEHFHRGPARAASPV